MFERSVIVTLLAPRACDTSSRLNSKLKYFRVRLSVARRTSVLTVGTTVAATRSARVRVEREVVEPVLRDERAVRVEGVVRVEVERAIVFSVSASVARRLV